MALAAVVCLSACLEREGNVDYGAIFVEDRVVEWEITIEADSWNKLLLKPEEYVPAQVTVDGTDYSIGLRLMGDVGRAKKTMRIRFDFVDPEQELHGVKRVNLRAGAGDPSLLREAMALTLFDGSAVPAPRHSFVWVGGFGGGAGGLYTLVEQVDRKFLEDRFGEDSGHLFKVETGGDLLYVDDSPASYDTAIYELKAGEPDPGYQHLVDFIRLLNKTPQAELERALEAALDLDGFLRALCVNTWLSNLDAYPGAGGNIYLYRESGGRFHYIPWDLNQAFGNFHGPPCDYTTDQLLNLEPEKPTCGAVRPLVDRLLAVPAIRERYRRAAQTLLAGPLEPSAVIAAMRAARDLIKDRARQDTLKESSNADFDAALTTDLPDASDPKRVPGLEAFVHKRAAAFQGMSAKQ
jgi:spore coat protein CotH